MDRTIRCVDRRDLRTGIAFLLGPFKPSTESFRFPSLATFPEQLRRGKSGNGRGRQLDGVFQCQRVASFGLVCSIERICRPLECGRMAAADVKAVYGREYA